MPANTPAPLVLVILAALLISCNVLWLYTTPDNTPRSVCGYLVDSWTGGHSGGRDKDLNVSSVTLPGAHDYQLVRGSGLTDVPFPIPIPNDTVILGDDIGRDDGLRQRYMTIGIASVWRKEEYLHRTLDSLLRETSEDDKKDIFIFLLLADADPDVRQSRGRALEAQYRRHIDAGIIRVLQPPALLYPSIDFATIRRTYNDSVSRVQWRTKQVLDFAFLFWYAWTRQPSTYYLILEDDVLAARHFVTAVRDFVLLHAKREWVALQLSGFMGIGQLIRCRDLDRLVSFLLLFYKEHPVDVLFSHWVSMMVPQKPPKDCPYRRVPGLFQHVGIHSTLANKTQTLRDSTFSLVRRRYSHVNPPAEVVTTIRQYKSFVARLAYSSAPGMFWGIPKAGDTYDIVFQQPLPVTRIVIVTGAALTKKKTRDKLLFGQLQVSPSFVRMLSPKRASCSDFVAVKEFQNGEVDAKDLDEHFAKGIQCVRVVIGSKQRTWISISEIAVFTNDVEHGAVATSKPLSGGGGSGRTVSVKTDVSRTEVNPSSGEKIRNGSNSLTKSVGKKSALSVRSSESVVRVARDSGSEGKNDINDKVSNDKLHGPNHSSVVSDSERFDSNTAPSNASGSSKPSVPSEAKVIDTTDPRSKPSKNVDLNLPYEEAFRKLMSVSTENSGTRTKPSYVTIPSDRNRNSSTKNIEYKNQDRVTQENTSAKRVYRGELEEDIESNLIEDSGSNTEYNRTFEPELGFNSSDERLFRLRKLRYILLNTRNSSIVYADENGW